MLHPTVFNTSEICSAYGVRHAVMSPGSRNAPLIISFARNNNINKWIIPDERSAGFIALGIAQKLKQPVVLCCTSGTALLNYAPAIAEAFYKELPLIVLSADRPPELIGQRDGQTIRQFEALRNHVKISLQLPLIDFESDKKKYTEGLNKGLTQSRINPIGPVHLNIPFREPFYPTENQVLAFDSFKVENLSSESTDLIKNPRPDEFRNKKVLILVGQYDKEDRLSLELKKLDDSIPIVKSPLNNLEINGIEHIDLFLDDQEELKPDILITSGLSVLSKKLKTFFRKNTPKLHLHFDPSGVTIDTYASAPKIIRSSLASYLKELDLKSVNADFLNLWKSYSNTVKDSLRSFFSDADFSESKAFHHILKSLPSTVELHLGNSMPVRFADFFGVKSGIETWCNRGTSGIDGCTSTAIGTSLVSNKQSVLLTGDLSFLYDRNAFFHNYRQSNFRVIVFNNSGGGIFRLIDGSKKLPELEEYFETRHDRTAEYICLENKIEYIQAKDLEEINQCLKTFYRASSKAKLLEVFTDPAANENVFKKFKSTIHEQVNR